MDQRSVFSSAVFFAALCSHFGMFNNSLIFAANSVQQNLIVTVPSSTDLTVSDHEIEVKFDPMLAINGIQELNLSSTYNVTNIGTLQMIVASVSEVLIGIDFFVTLSSPSGPSGGAVPVSRGEVKLSTTPQSLVSGIANCIGSGEINYRTVARFPEIPEGSFNERVVVVTFTVAPSSA